MKKHLILTGRLGRTYTAREIAREFMDREVIYTVFDRNKPLHKIDAFRNINEDTRLIIIEEIISEEELALVITGIHNYLKSPSAIINIRVVIDCMRKITTNQVHKILGRFSVNYGKEMFQVKECNYQLNWS